MNNKQRFTVLNYIFKNRMCTDMGFVTDMHIPDDRVDRFQKMFPGLPKGFGPRHPQWSVPSFKNKWLYMLELLNKEQREKQ